MNAEALAIACETWRRAPNLSTAQRVIAAYERHRRDLALKPCRLAIARAFTVEPLVPLLRAAAYTDGVELDVYVGGPNSHETELLDPGSALYRFEPQIVVLATNTASFAPALWQLEETVKGSLQREAERVYDQLSSRIATFRANCNAELIVHSLDVPDLSWQSAPNDSIVFHQRDAILGVNDRLRALARNTPGTYVLDYDGLVARYGRRLWRDESKWERFQLPAAAANLRFIAEEWMRFIVPLTGSIAKIVAVDLDNTLWGGVIGEDGLSRLQMGAEYPGSCYRAVQKALLVLRNRGILLAICSKNNIDDAREVLERHPDMVLRSEHFASQHINWEPKSRNLSALAEELHVGVDAIALLDDNPVERFEVQSLLPQVRIIALPNDPARCAQAILEAPCFSRLRLSSDDLLRSNYYQQERFRNQAMASVSSREGFLESLQLEAHIEPVTTLHVARAAQLTQKTNQFNLTSKRYGEAQIQEFLSDPAYRVVIMKLRDRFGDSGFIGLAITREAGQDAIIDTFLLSCRVIGRGAETALLAHIVQEARGAGKAHVLGNFRSTSKNEPSRPFFRDHGFRLVDESQDQSTWNLALENATVQPPDFMKVNGFERAPA